jgi:hypothetical protein
VAHLQAGSNEALKAWRTRRARDPLKLASLASEASPLKRLAFASDQVAR